MPLVPNTNGCSADFPDFRCTRTNVQFAEPLDYADGRISYRLYYEYSAMDGRVILVQVSSLLRQIPTVGTKLRMLVDPQKPKILRRTGVQEYMAPVLIAQVGFVMLLLEIILY